MISEKFITFENLETKLLNLKQEKKWIVLCHGCFDILHFGHAIHFNEAKKNGDILIVSITKDKFINKGHNRPIFNEEERAYLLCQLSSIDFVTINNTASAEDIIKIVKPEFYVKGKEYSDNKGSYNNLFDIEKKMVELYGGKVIFSKGKTSSSTLAVKKLYDKTQI